jgi:hypothetical protein
MGYYTQFSFEYEPWKNCSDEEYKRFEEYIQEKNIDGGYASLSEVDEWDSCKWYEHTSEMKAISAKFPHVLMILGGKGEEPGDIWKKYYLNGKVQIALAEIVIPAFSEKLLK